MEQMQHVWTCYNTSFFRIENRKILHFPISIGQTLNGLCSSFSVCAWKLRTARPVEMASSVLGDAMTSLPWLQITPSCLTCLCLAWAHLSHSGRCFLSSCSVRQTLWMVGLRAGQKSRQLIGAWCHGCSLRPKLSWQVVCWGSREIWARSEFREVVLQRSSSENEVVMHGQGLGKFTLGIFLIWMNEYHIRLPLAKDDGGTNWWSCAPI